MLFNIHVIFLVPMFLKMILLYQTLYQTHLFN